MWPKLNLCLVPPLCVWIICAICIEDVGAPPSTTNPQTPFIPTTPTRPKTLPLPRFTPHRPKTLTVPFTPKRRQILPSLPTPKRPRVNGVVTNITGVVTNITGPSSATTSNPLTKKPTPVCEDYHVKCKRWSKFGYCYNGYVRNYMKKTCKKSCGFCGHMTGRCRDNHYYCPSWTWRGGCQRHAAFMRLNCRHSCHVC